MHNMLISSRQLHKTKISLHLYRETDLFANFERHGGIRTTGEFHGLSAERGATTQAQDNDMSTFTLESGELLDGTGLRLRSLSEHKKSSIWPSLPKFWGKEPDLPEHLSRLNFTAQDARRWKMAWQAIQACKMIDLQNPGDENISSRLQINSLPRLVTERCRDWPDTGDIFGQTAITLGFSVTAFIYGGLHALAWSAPFKSFTEQLLWRTCACAVMGCLPILFVLNAIMAYLHENHHNLWEESIMVYLQEKHHDSWKEFISDWTIHLLLVLAFVLVIWAYFLARIYLVIECFINLSHLPAGVYDVPNWSAYFPHIS